MAARRVIEEFIQIYRTNPCLWEIKNVEYRDQKKREAAYRLLVDKLKEIEPDANRSHVVKKINNLRSSVRKEKKKYERSVKSATTPDDVYHIKLWYYDLFHFLNDQYTSRKSSNNLDEDNSSDEANPLDSFVEVEDQQYPSSSNSELSDNDEAQGTPSYSKSSGPATLQKIKKEDETIEIELESARDHLKRPRSNFTEDRCDIIGKNVAMKLRTLDAKQALIAEKLINDVLFEAEFGHLTPEHAYINLRDIFSNY